MVLTKYMCAGGLHIVNRRNIYMKQAVIFGDLTSDRTSEQYPTVTLCENCIREDEAQRENSQIVHMAGEADADDAVCEWCGAEDDA